MHSKELGEDLTHPFPSVATSLSIGLYRLMKVRIETCATIG